MDDRLSTPHARSVFLSKSRQVIRQGHLQSRNASELWQIPLHLKPFFAVADFQSHCDDEFSVSHNARTKAGLRDHKIYIEEYFRFSVIFENVAILGQFANESIDRLQSISKRIHSEESHLDRRLLSQYQMCSNIPKVREL